MTPTTLMGTAKRWMILETTGGHRWPTGRGSEVQAIPKPVEEPAPIAPHLLVEEAVQVTPPQPAEEVIEVVPQPAAEETQFSIDPEFSLYSPNNVSTVSSPFDLGVVPTVSSSLASELPSEWPTVTPLRATTYTRSINSVPPSLPGPFPIGRPESLPTTTLLSSVIESTPSTISSCRLEPSRLSIIDESQSSKSPPITYLLPSSPSLTPTDSVFGLDGVFHLFGSDILDNRLSFEEPILEDVSTEPSLLSTHRTTVLRPRMTGNATTKAFTTIPPTVTGKASLGVIAIPLTPPPRSPRSLSSLSSSISSLSSQHSDDSSLLGSEPLETELFETEPDVPRESSSPISSSPISASAVSSATVRAVPTTPGIDCEVIKRIRDVLDAVKGQTDALWDGQLSTNHILDELRQRVPRTQDNTELVEWLQRLEDLINRLADSQARARAPSPPPESLFDSAVPILPPPTFVPLNFRPDARGPRPRSASPTLLGDLPPLRPFTVPIPEPLITRDIGCLEVAKPLIAFVKPSSFVAKQGLDQIALGLNKCHSIASSNWSALVHSPRARIRHGGYTLGIADPTAVSFELLTVLGAGPLAVFIMYQIVQRDLARALLDCRALHGEALQRASTNPPDSSSLSASFLQDHPGLCRRRVSDVRGRQNGALRGAGVEDEREAWRRNGRRAGLSSRSGRRPMKPFFQVFGD
ncbi:hypothetical protein EDB83DRAFT_2319302 [Lactarius deliciosus]|nr:hypothetical protein EDB83DRAFT_2319302 [Lactarius deliciosus]